MNRLTLLFLVAIVSATMSSGPRAVAQDNELRKWWSYDGVESIQASLESYDKKTKLVSLKTAQDKTIQVKISLLSRADRRFVTNASKKKPSVFKVLNDEDSSKESLEPGQRATNKKRAANKKQTGVTKQYGINWTVGVENALTSAMSNERRRPVMLFRVLGELDGFM